MAGRLGRKAALVALVRAFKPGTPGLGRRIAALPRMIRASLRGEYDGLARIAAIGLATGYILSPVDLVPELFTAVFGLVDDAMVATWLAGAVLSETERFLEWERRRAGIVPGHVVNG